LQHFQGMLQPWCQNDLLPDLQFQLGSHALSSG
jgi:hypothetical protein